MDDTLIPASEMKRRVPGTTDQTWATMRHKGTGPRYVKIAGRVYYWPKDLADWMAANTYTRPDRPVSA